MTGNTSEYEFRQRALARTALVEALREIGEDDEGLQCALESETDDIEALRATVRMVIEADAQAETLKELARTYRDRAERKAAQSQRGRGGIHTYCETLNIRKLSLPEATISVGKGQPNVIVTDEQLVPMAYRKADPRLEQAFYQLLRASNYAAANGHPEMAEDFKHTAQIMLPFFNIDRRKVQEALKTDETVAGCTLSNPMPHLTLRVR